MNLIEAFRSEIFKIFEEDKTAIYLGEDVRNAHRGIAIGLHERYGSERVIDMPISESAFTGIALGLAIKGKTVFVEYNFAGLLYLGLDQIFNQAHKYNEMMNSGLNLKLTYIFPTGTKGGMAGQHSDNPYALLTHLGLPTLMPSNEMDCIECVKYINRLNKPSALFLPVQSFYNEMKIDAAVMNGWMGFYKLSEGEKLNIIATGTTINIVNEAIKETNLDAPNIYIITDLEFNDKTKACINNIEPLPTIFIDDSFEKCGIASELERYIERKLWMEPVSRLDRNVPFNQELENRVLVSKQRVAYKLKGFM